MKDAKGSKLEVIGSFDPQSMFCAERELKKSKRSDSSGIKKLTSITFWKSKSRKIKRQKAWKSHPLSQISHSASVDFWSLKIQYLELQKFI